MQTLGSSSYGLNNWVPTQVSETWIAFLSPGFGPYLPCLHGHLGNKQVDGCSLCISNEQIIKCKKKKKAVERVYNKGLFSITNASNQLSCNTKVDLKTKCVLKPFEQITLLEVNELKGQPLDLISPRFIAKGNKQNHALSTCVVWQVPSFRTEKFHFTMVLWQRWTIPNWCALRTGSWAMLRLKRALCAATDGLQTWPDCRHLSSALTSCMH